MKEIERKFLVEKAVNEQIKLLKGDEIKQGYLSVDQNSTIRVRLRNQNAFLTIKSKTIGITRDEFEYQIPYQDALELMRLCGNRTLEKTRYSYDFHGKTWEIDVFAGRHEGLILAEIELSSENEHFETPDWIKEEVSDTVEYYNSNLSLL